jgi:hypothetical protein
MRVKKDKYLLSEVANEFIRACPQLRTRSKRFEL